MQKQAEQGLVPSLAGGKFLTFFLGDEEYGIEILTVREIIGLLPVTRVPHTPAAVRGVINLRGKVIPVVDLRLRFGLPATQESQRTCIVVVQTRGAEFGLVVDQVSEVVDVATEDLEPPPSFGALVSTEHLLGIAKDKDRVRLLLDIDRVLDAHEMSEFRQWSAESSGGRGGG